MTGKVPTKNPIERIPPDKRNGRPKGVPNKLNSALKHTLLLAGEFAGHKVAVRNEIERLNELRDQAEREERQLTPEELKPQNHLIENNGLLTYLVDLALKSPTSYASLLGKLIPVQQDDEVRGITVDGNVNIPSRIIVEMGYIDHRPFDAG
jgi:hypothetical protein